MIITNFRYIYIHNLSNISTFSLNVSGLLKPTHPSHSLFDYLGVVCIFIVHVFKFFEGIVLQNLKIKII